MLLAMAPTEFRGQFGVSRAVDTRAQHDSRSVRSVRMAPSARTASSVTSLHLKQPTRCTDA